MPNHHTSIEIFIAYARKDDGFLQDLLLHLRPLKRTGNVKTWHDGVMEAGTTWEKDIKNAIHRADIILLLVSAHSLNSDYFYETELKQALERHQKDKVQLIPIIVSPCLWTTDPIIKQLQALPKDGLPIVKWTIPDDAYTNIVEELSLVVDKIKTKREQEHQTAIKLADLKQKALHYFEQNNPAQTLHYLLLALDISPADKDLLQLQTQANALKQKHDTLKRQKETQQQLQNLTAAAQQHLKQQQFEQALTCLQTALQISPNNAQLLQLQTQAQEQLELQTAENERKAKEKAEQAEKERKERLENERKAKEKADQAARERQAKKESKERLENERKAKEKADQEAREQQAEKERQERLESERKAKEKADQEARKQQAKFLKTANIVVVLLFLGWMGYNYVSNNFFRDTSPSSEGSTPNPPPSEGSTPNSPPSEGLGEASMVLVKGGTFTMGSPNTEADREDDEYQHQVTLDDFYMGKYEVTQAQWNAIMGSNPSSFKGDNLPVESVSWDDIQVFLKRLNQKTGKSYRLPTEAEWEYAARGGTTTPFSTGNCLSTDQANYNGNYPYQSCAKGQYREQTTEVGSFAPNKYGLYDMHGNVWEWCQDWYDADYYKNSPTNNPTGPTSGSARVLRGGSWFSDAVLCRVADRSSYTPGRRYYGHGFRLVLIP